MKHALRLGFLIGIASCAAAGRSQDDGSGSPETRIERGRYLAHEVAMCVQCHTPRREDGSLETLKLFDGAPVPLASPFPQSPWTFRAPHIRGLPGYTEEDGIRLLSEGITRNGTPPSPPMPPFRMSRADAEAVVAYLKSLD